MLTFVKKRSINLSARLVGGNDPIKRESRRGRESQSPSEVSSH